MTDATTPVPVRQDESPRAAYQPATPREVSAITPALACGGSAASRLLQAVLRGHPSLAVWG